jgi:hypothetical protein
MSDVTCEGGTELRGLRAPRAAPVFLGPTADRARPVLQAPQEPMALPERRARTEDAEAQGRQVLKARPERLALREPKATKADPGTKLPCGRHPSANRSVGS